MKYSLRNIAKIIPFSHLSKKGYAVFVGINKLVKIGQIAIHICYLSLLKSSKKGVLVNDSKTISFFSSRDNIDESIFEFIYLLLFVGDNYAVSDDIINNNNTIT